MRLRRHLPIALALLTAASLAACGGDSDAQRAAPGTPENPLVAQASDPEDAGAAPAQRVGEPAARPADAPAYDELVKEQTERPQERFTPCNLVTEREAQAIVGAPIEQPFEAPQGPTCIYRTQTGKGMVALAVQTADFTRIKPRIRRLREVAVADRAAFCGTYGQPVLYVPLDSGRILSVSASCDVAQSFARKALRHL